MVSGGRASEEGPAWALGAATLGVPVAPAMPVAAVVGPVWLACDDELLPEDDDVARGRRCGGAPPLVVGAALPLVPTVPTGPPGTEESEEDVDSGALPEPLIRMPVKSSPVIETRVSGSVPPLTIAAVSSRPSPGHSCRRREGELDLAQRDRPEGGQGADLVPVLVDVCGICPALHELSATGAISRQPMGRHAGPGSRRSTSRGFTGSRRPGARLASAYRHPQDGCREVRPVVDGPGGTGHGCGLGAPWTDGDPALDVFPGQAPATRRWLFADQLGPHFLDDPDQLVLLVEAQACSPAAASTGRRPTSCSPRCATAPPSWASRRPPPGAQLRARRSTAATSRCRFARRHLEQPRPRPRRPRVQVLAARGFVNTQEEFALGRHARVAGTPARPAGC